MNRLYPVGIQNFEDLRSRGYIYVDKNFAFYIPWYRQVNTIS